MFLPLHSTNVELSIDQVHDYVASHEREIAVTVLIKTEEQ